MSNFNRPKPIPTITWSLNVFYSNHVLLVAKPLVGGAHFFCSVFTQTTIQIWISILTTHGWIIWIKKIRWGKIHQWFNNKKRGNIGGSTCQVLASSIESLYYAFFGWIMKTYTIFVVSIHASPDFVQVMEALIMV